MLERSQLLFPLLCVALGAAVFSAPAAAGDATVEAALPLGNEACPGLFGGDRQRITNRSAREARLREVAVTRQGIEVVHTHGAWKGPRSMRVPGVKLVGTAPSSGHALVEVDERYGTVCAPGTYRVRPDDALGSRGRVLAVFAGGVLIENDAGLGVLSPGKRSPKVQMVWRSDYQLKAVEARRAGGAPKTVPGRTPIRQERTAASAVRDDGGRETRRAKVAPDGSPAAKAAATRKATASAKADIARAARERLRGSDAR